MLVRMQCRENKEEPNVLRIECRSRKREKSSQSKHASADASCRSQNAVGEIREGTYSLLRDFQWPDIQGKGVSTVVYVQAVRSAKSTRLEGESTLLEVRMASSSTASAPGHAAGHAAAKGTSAAEGGETAASSAGCAAHATAAHSAEHVEDYGTELVNLLRWTR